MTTTAATAIRKLGRLEFAWAKMDSFVPVIFAGALHLAHAPSAETLRHALDMLQRRRPMLRVSITQNDGDFWFSLAEAPGPIPLEVLPRRDAEHWRSAVEDQLVQPFEPGTAPLARFVLLQGDPDSDLLCCFHHAIIDSRSGEALVGELLAACADLMAGNTPEADGTEQGVSPPLDALLPGGFRGAARLGRLTGFVARQMLEEARYRRRLGNRQSVDAGLPARPRLLSVQWTECETRKITRAARQSRVTVNGLLQAAMLLALWRVRYAGTSLPMRAIYFGDLRPHLRPPPKPAQMGVYITMLQCTADVGPESQLWDLARLITGRIGAAMGSGDKFSAALLSRTLVQFLLKRRSMRMGMIALSFPGPLPIATQYGPIRVNGLSGAVANNPLGPELAGFGIFMNDRLSLDLQYLDSDMDAESARQVAQHLRTLLHDGTHAQGATS